MNELSRSEPNLIPWDADAVMHRVARGDESALSALYDRMAPGVHRLAHLVTGGVLTADDVVRSTFVEVWREAPDPEATGGAGVETWILATAHRLARVAAGPGPGALRT